jgi:hypothetical protein
LRERSVARALGKRGGGAHWQRKKVKNGAVLPEYVSAKRLEQFIDSDIRQKLLIPIVYKTIKGTEAQGINAELLPEICNIWLKARENGALAHKQMETAKKAEILMRGLATIGIIALVDEATGYQEVRDRIALQEILSKYISKELMKWQKRFPDEYYIALFNLLNIQYRPLPKKKIC